MADQLVTLITGSRKGIGQFLAQHYVNRGHIVIGCSRDSCNWEMPGYEHFIADVSDESSVIPIFRHLRRKYGRLNHLVNNAGIASMNPVILSPISSVQRILSTNVIGTFLFCREGAKLMSKTGGRIVNLTTVATPLKLEGEAIYAASKAAIQSLTEIMAREFAEYNITVNAVGPTPVATDLIRSVPKQKINQLLQRQANKRFGTYTDIANVIDFYLSEESNFITGQNIFLGGV